MTNVLSKEASKAIADLGVEVESEMAWYPDINGVWGVLLNNGKPKHGKQSWCPAPNFQELLSALPEMGEKLGWGLFGPHNMKGNNLRCSDCGEQPHIGFGTCKRNYSPQSSVIAHRLTDLYLSGGMEAVSEEVLQLISKE